MARIFNGITGQFQGKVGTVVGATWKGIPYMRSRPKKRTAVVSKKESANRNRFAMAHKWLQPLTLFLREGFKGYTPTVEGFLAAKSYLLKNAFEGEGEHLVINPAKVKVSHGDLPLPENITAKVIGPNQIQFSWDTTTMPFDNRYDQAMVLAYDMEAELTRFNQKIALYELTGQFRSTGAHILNISPRDPEKEDSVGTYHCYIAFVSADRSRRSNSVYLGTVTL
jgi:hypothetical protein